MMIDEDTVTLQQMLQAMDKGLADEIKAQEQKPAHHTAMNGHLISENNRRFIYEFMLETPWDPEDDTTVVVKFGGTVDQDIKATIVNSTGIAIKIATEKPLPPEALQKIRLVDDSTQLLERLREALKSNDEGAALLGSKSFGLLPYTNNDWLPPVAFGTKFTPDDSQHRAITMALGSEVTYIIGPPGTGKTSTLAAIAFTHLCMGRSVLIAAHTNIAIDNAIMRIVDICNDSRNSTALQALEAGSIIRYGIPQLEERIKDEYSNIHLPTIVARHSKSLNQQWEALNAQINQLTKQSEQMEQERAQVIQGSQVERQRLVTQRETDTNRLNVLQKQEQARKADFQRRYHDLSSQHEHAQQQVHVFVQQQAHISNQQIQQKTIITNCTSRIDEIETLLTSAQQMNKLQRFFKGISTQDLARQHADNQQQRWSSEQALITLQKQMDELFAQRADAEKQAEHLTVAISTLQAQYNEASGEAQTIVHLQATIHELEQDIARIDSENASVRKRVEVSLREFTTQQAGLQKQIELVEAQLADIEKKIVAAAQVIATTLAKAYMNSNISERRFDVVIMDEVSMASLPAVYVAASHADQSVVIIGDPQQLAPIVQAKTNVAKEWLGRDLFTMRGITLSSTNVDSVMLNEQARMHPRIADIVRQHVYQGRLYHSPRVLNTERFQRYTAVQPLPGKPVLLCNTNDASPFATRPEGGSRINAYHALCSIELARQALLTLPERQVKKGEVSHRSRYTISETGSTSPTVSKGCGSN